MILCLGLGGFVLTLQADEESAHDRARSLRQSGEILPLSQITAKVCKHYPGRVLDAELEMENGAYRYELEILDANGRVWEIETDAVSGEIIEVEQED